MLHALQENSHSPLIPPSRTAGDAGRVAPPAKSGGPVCPKCRSSVNRVPRRFIDRLVSLFHPVHRYHCRSFVCSWEGNLPCSPSEADRWETPDANSEIQLPALLRRDPVDVPTAGAALGVTESVTLPAETTSGARHAGAGSGDVSSLALPAKKRRKANSR